ncbi:MAG TPA: thioredoxin-dependent thiol peroxidase [archaeon]|nr:thioredoxin-dependent thiol peroxidase [archaeon]
MLKEGDKAPDFTLNDGDGKKVKLSGFKGKKIVLYFYPKDDTEGCTKEACNLRDNMVKLKNMVILGVSLDDEDSHKKFAEKYSLPFRLLADTDKAVSKKYGIYVQKNMYGNKYWGIKRTTFIIENGVIKKIFGKVDVSNHADQIKEVL